MNHAEEVKKFKFEAMRCKSSDKYFMNLVDHTLFGTIDTMTVFKMRARVYNNEGIEWVIKVMKNHQETFSKDMLEELAPHFEAQI